MSSRENNSVPVNPFPDDKNLDCFNLKDVAEENSKQVCRYHPYRRPDTHEVFTRRRFLVKYHQNVRLIIEPCIIPTILNTQTLEYMTMSDDLFMKVVDFVSCVKLQTNGNFELHILARFSYLQVLRKKRRFHPYKRLENYKTRNKEVEVPAECIKASLAELRNMKQLTGKSSPVKPEIQPKFRDNTTNHDKTDEIISTLPSNDISVPANDVSSVGNTCCSTDEECKKLLLTENGDKQTEEQENISTVELCSFIQSKTENVLSKEIVSLSEIVGQVVDALVDNIINSLPNDVDKDISQPSNVDNGVNHQHKDKEPVEAPNSSNKSARNFELRILARFSYLQVLRRKRRFHPYKRLENYKTRSKEAEVPAECIKAALAELRIMKKLTGQKTPVKPEIQPKFGENTSNHDKTQNDKIISASPSNDISVPANDVSSVGNTCNGTDGQCRKPLLTENGDKQTEEQENTSTVELCSSIQSKTENVLSKEIVSVSEIVGQVVDALLDNIMNSLPNDVDKDISQPSNIDNGVNHQHDNEPVEAPNFSDKSAPILDDIDTESEIDSETEEALLRIGSDESDCELSLSETTICQLLEIDPPNKEDKKVETSNCKPTLNMKGVDDEQPEVEAAATRNSTRLDEPHRQLVMNCEQMSSTESGDKQVSESERNDKTAITDETITVHDSHTNSTTNQLEEVDPVAVDTKIVESDTNISKRVNVAIQSLLENTGATQLKVNEDEDKASSSLKIPSIHGPAKLDSEPCQQMTEQSMHKESTNDTTQIKLKENKLDVTVQVKPKESCLDVTSHIKPEEIQPNVTKQARPRESEQEFTKQVKQDLILQAKPKESKPGFSKEAKSKESKPSVTKETKPKESMANVTNQAKPNEIKPDVTKQAKPKESKPDVTKQAKPNEIQPNVTKKARPKENKSSLATKKLSKEKKSDVTKEAKPKESKPDITTQAKPNEINPAIAKEAKPKEVKPNVTKQTKPNKIKPDVTEEAQLKEIKPNVTEQAKPRKNIKDVNKLAKPAENKSDDKTQAKPRENQQNENKVAKAAENKSDVSTRAKPRENKQDVNILAKPVENKPDIIKQAKPRENKLDVNKLTKPAESKPDVKTQAKPRENKLDVTKQAKPRENKLDVNKLAKPAENKLDVTKHAKPRENKLDVNKLAKPAENKPYVTKQTKPRENKLDVNKLAKPPESKPDVAKLAKLRESKPGVTVQAKPKENSRDINLHDKRESKLDISEQINPRGANLGFNKKEKQKETIPRVPMKQFTKHADPDEIKSNIATKEKLEEIKLESIQQTKTTELSQKVVPVNNDRIVAKEAIFDLREKLRKKGVTQNPDVKLAPKNVGDVSEDLALKPKCKQVPIKLVVDDRASNRKVMPQKPKYKPGSKSLGDRNLQGVEPRDSKPNVEPKALCKPEQTDFGQKNKPGVNPADFISVPKSKQRQIKSEDEIKSSIRHTDLASKPKFKPVPVTFDEDKKPEIIPERTYKANYKAASVETKVDTKLYVNNPVAVGQKPKFKPVPITFGEEIKPRMDQVTMVPKPKYRTASIKFEEMNKSSVKAEAVAAKPKFKPVPITFGEERKPTLQQCDMVKTPKYKTVPNKLGEENKPNVKAEVMPPKPKFKPIPITFDEDGHRKIDKFSEVEKVEFRKRRFASCLDQDDPRLKKLKLRY